MYAILKTGGKQYKVTKDDVIQVELLPVAVGEQVSLDKILMIVADGEVNVGKPFVNGAKVEATVLGQVKGKKIRIFKMRRRKHYRKSMGHRQNYTELKIDNIVL